MKCLDENQECEFQRFVCIQAVSGCVYVSWEHCQQCCCYDARHRSDTADRREGLGSIEDHPIRLNSPCCSYQQGFS
jgi:hypothetical protein